MTSNILQGIANPAVADIAGSFGRGQDRRIAGENRQLVLDDRQRASDDRQRASDERSMSAKIVEQSLPYRFANLANSNPKEAMKLATALGFTSDPVVQMQHLAGVFQGALAVGKGAGPKEATAWMREAQKFMQSQYGPGSTNLLDGMIAKMGENPEEGMEALQLGVD
jgi:hypothetical protein